MEHSVLPRKGQFGYDGRTPKAHWLLGGMGTGKSRERKAETKMENTKGNLFLFSFLD